MCALRLSTHLKNYIVNQGIVKQMAGTMGTGGTASIKIYTGTQPDSPDTDIGTEVLLCTIIGIGWGGSNGTIGATQGTASFGTSIGYTGTAATTGVAGWARLETVGVGYTGSAATFRIDGDVGVSGTCAFVINSTAITALGSVVLTSAPISVG
jgi:hypothetical protein